MNRIAFGTIGISGEYSGGEPLPNAEGILSYALERGVRLIHTAEHYGEGNALRIIKNVLSGGHSFDDVKIMAKINISRLQGGPEGIESTLRGLCRDCIDYVQLVGWSPYSEQIIPVQDILTQLSFRTDLRSDLKRYQAAGIIGKIGVEVFSPGEAAMAAETEGIDFIVGDYSILRQAVPIHCLPGRVREGSVWMAGIRPLGGGWLTDKYKDIGDFPLSDRRREWYAPAENLRRAVEPIIARLPSTLVQTALRFAAQHEQPRLIIVGMCSQNHVDIALSPDSVQPLPPAIYTELLNLFEQPTTFDD